jgi:hypothetical protein
MKANAKILYTDDEASFSSYYLTAYFNKECIKHYITRNHAAFAERFIRTYKALLYKRIDSINNNNIIDPQWKDYNYQILLTYYNKPIHSSTQLIPADAMQDSNEADVKANMESRAKHKRNYPPLNVDDSVKLLRKSKVNEQEGTSCWSEETYKVSAINEEFGQQYYKLSGIDYRDYSRGELLNI